MADTLTYDPVQADAPELSEEEQSSLEVGEKLAEEQQQLLAGKYKNAEELEKAYVELQQKLGSNEKEGKEEPEATEVKEEAPTEDDNPSITLLNDASAEWNEKGELTPETMEKFSEMSSKDIVSAYIELQKNAPKVEAPELTDKDINLVKNSVGGEKQYSELISWAGENLETNQVEAFDSVVSTGNIQAIRLMVAGIKAEYDNTNGYEGRMLSGKAAASSSDVFRSQAEVVSAMNDAKYEKDPAYRQDVYEKLERSDLKY